MTKADYPKLHVTDWPGDANVPDGCSIGINDDFGADGGRDYFLFTAVHGDPDELKDHAERLVLLWNLGRDIPTETLAILEGDNALTLGKISERFEKMKRVLEWVEKSPGCHRYDLQRAVRNALRF